MGSSAFANGPTVQVDDIRWSLRADGCTVDPLTLTDIELFDRVRTLENELVAVRAVLSEALRQLVAATAHLSFARQVIRARRSADRSMV
jgi:hypothetical protein